MTAAEAFINAATQIVRTTGCSVEAAVDYLSCQIATQRPELLVKVALTGPFANMEV